MCDRSQVNKSFKSQLDLLIFSLWQLYVQKALFPILSWFFSNARCHKTFNPEPCDLPSCCHTRLIFFIFFLPYFASTSRPRVLFTCVRWRWFSASWLWETSLSTDKTREAAVWQLGSHVALPACSSAASSCCFPPHNWNVHVVNYSWKGAGILPPWQSKEQKLTRVVWDVNVTLLKASEIDNVRSDVKCGRFLSRFGSV